MPALAFTHPASSLRGFGGQVAIHTKSLSQQVCLSLDGIERISCRWRQAAATCWELQTARRSGSKKMQAQRHDGKPVPPIGQIFDLKSSVPGRRYRIQIKLYNHFFISFIHAVKRLPGIARMSIQPIGSNQ